MTLGFGEWESQFLAKVFESFKLEHGNKIGSNRNEIVNVHLSLHLPTPTVSSALAKTARVESARKRRNFSSEAVINSSGDSLGKKGGCPIPKGHHQVQESEASPSENEELDLAWIKKEPPVIPGKVK